MLAESQNESLGNSSLNTSSEGEKSTVGDGQNGEIAKEVDKAQKELTELNVNESTASTSNTNLNNGMTPGKNRSLDELDEKIMWQMINLYAFLFNI